MPAPPLESDDAMLSTRAIRVTSTPYAGMTQIRFAGVISAPPGGHPGRRNLPPPTAPTRPASLGSRAAAVGKSPGAPAIGVHATRAPAPQVMAAGVDLSRNWPTPPPPRNT